MGVKGLWHLIKKFCYSISLEELRGKRIAIDVNIWLHQASKSQKMGRKHCLIILFRRIARLLFYNIKPVFVFDGEAPLLKRQVIYSRRQTRNCAANKVETTKNRLVKRLLMRLAQESIEEHSPNKSKSLNKYSSKKIIEKLSQLSSSIKDKEDDELFKCMEFDDELLKDSVKNDSNKEWDHIAFEYLDRIHDDTSKFEYGFESEAFKQLPNHAQLRIIKLSRLEFDNKLRYVRPELELEKNTSMINSTSTEFSNHQLNKMLSKRMLREKEQEISKKILMEETNDVFRVTDNYDVQENSDNTRRIISREREHAIFIDKVDPVLAKKSVNDRLMAMLNPKQINSEHKNSFFHSVKSDVSPTVLNKTDWSESTNEPVQKSEIYLDVPKYSIDLLKNEEIDDNQIDTTKLEASDVKIESSQKESVDTFPSVRGISRLAENESFDRLYKSDNNSDSLEKSNDEQNLKNINNSDQDFIQALENNKSDVDSFSQSGDSSFQSVQEDESEINELLDEENSRCFSQIDDKISDFEELNQNEDDFELDDESLFQELETRDRQAQNVSNYLVDDIRFLAQLFGCPCIQSPEEAEAQCAKLESLGLVDLIATEDSDVWLFGARKVCRHLFGGDRDVGPQMYTANEVEKHLGLSQSGFISLAMLCGSDYTQGIKKIGPVTGMEILSEFTSNENSDDITSIRKEILNTLGNFKRWSDENSPQKYLNLIETRRKWPKFLFDNNFPDPSVINAYLEPKVIIPEKLEWLNFKSETLIPFLCNSFNWSPEYAQKHIDTIMKGNSKKTIISPMITDYFSPSIKHFDDDCVIIPSKRLRNASSKITKQKLNSPKSKKRVNKK